MLTRYGQKDLAWVDLVGPTPAEILQVTREFELDPLIAEELSCASSKSKAERHGGHLYVVLHFPLLRSAHGRSEQEVDFVIGNNFLITSRYEPVSPLDSFAKSFEVAEVLGRQGNMHGGHLFASLASNIYRSLTAECEGLRHRLDDAEDRIFRGHEREMVARLSALGRTVHDFRRGLESHTEMLRSLEPLGEKLFGASFPYHVRGVVGECERLRHTLSHLREWLMELRETNNSLLSLKQNETMKNLTVMALMTFPLVLFSSLFAIEARDVPILGMPGDFWIITGMMLTIAACLLFYFKYRKWI